jgi:hypothetical protein
VDPPAFHILASSPNEFQPPLRRADRSRLARRSAGVPAARDVASYGRVMAAVTVDEAVPGDRRTGVLRVERPHGGLRAARWC